MYHTTHYEPAALLLLPKPGGLPIKYPRREIVNAILYILSTGAAWRMSPRYLPPYRIFSTTTAPGSRSTRLCAGKPGRARAAITNPALPFMDRQLVKTTEADVRDRDGARLVLKVAAGRFPRPRLIWADGGVSCCLVGMGSGAVGCRLRAAPLRVPSLRRWHRQRRVMRAARS